MKIHESGLYVPDQVPFGSGKVELFSERGKKQLEVPFDNYVGQELLTYQRFMSRWIFGFAHPRTATNSPTHYWNQHPYNIAWTTMGSMPGDGPPWWPMNVLLLTSDDSPIDTAVRSVKGATVGWANKQSPYSGSDHQRGVVNTSESVGSGRTYYRWVFDWPTHAANGTYQSIYWAGAFGNDYSSNLGVVGWLHQHNAYDNCYFDHGGNTTNGGWVGNNWLYGMAISKIADLGFVSGSQYWDGFRFSARPWQTTDRISARRSGFFIHDMAIIGDEVYLTHRTKGDAGVRVYPAESTVYDHSTIQTPTRTLDLDNAVMGDYLRISSNGTHLFAFSTLNPNQIRRYGTDGTLLATINLPAYITNAVQYWYDANGVKQSQPNYDILAIHGQADNSVKIQFINRTRGWLVWAHISATGQVISVAEAQGGPRPDWSFEHPDGRIFAGSYTQWRDMPSWHNTGNLGTRTRLADPITKSNLQTMKITYQFDFADL